VGKVKAKLENAIPLASFKSMIRPPGIWKLQIGTGFRRAPEWREE